MSEELKSDSFDNILWTKTATITATPSEKIEIYQMTYDSINDCFEVWINKEFRKYVRGK